MIKDDKKYSCGICEKISVIEALDIGSFPPSNKFKYRHENDSGPVFPISLGACSNCGTIQLTKKMPIDIVRPLYPWISYTEPEEHIQSLANKILSFDNISLDSKVLGITSYDKSLVDCLINQGMHNATCLESSKICSIVEPYGLETLQEVYSSADVFGDFIEDNGRFDIVIARRFMEHAYLTKKSIKSLSSLLNPGGYFVIEVPDSSKILENSNHAFIWEEHISYFTENSLKNLANKVGAYVYEFLRYSYPEEDSIIISLQFNVRPKLSYEKTTASHIKDSFESLSKFCESFYSRKNYWQTYLHGLRINNKKIALFGAGHLAVKFINFYELGEFFECVIDDNPNKIGLFMPGSNLEIVSSSQTLSKNISVIVSTLNMATFNKISKKFEAFLVRGGEIVQAFN